MVQVGITGGIGSGKSLFCSVLEKLGVPVYYADQQARNLMNSHVVLKQRIIDLLGEEAYQEGGLDRKYVGSRVFRNRETLEKLNSLVHPVVREDYRRWVSGWKEVPYVVEEAAILFESGAYRFLDLTVLVLRIHPGDIRVRDRRDGVGKEEVQLRMNHQMDEEEKRMLADEVLINNDRQLLLPQVVALHNKVLNWK